MKNEETIAAIATPRGEGGIGVIRLSGTEALKIITPLFTAGTALANQSPRTARHGWFVFDGIHLDEVVVTFFPGPKSYTGEDVVEISCHGGTYVGQLILEAVLTRGAVPAGPGEFTRRAYLNGRLDLAKAEAVSDLIKARTEASRRAAVNMLRGGLTKKLDQMNSRLLRICAFLELELDFGEEDIQLAPDQDVRAVLQEAISETEKLLATYNRGRVCRQGVRLAISGRTNVGKSSLLNALTEKERAIVADIPGTTRDTIEDVLDLDGICFTITDTAGIRSSADPIEREGVRRSLEAIEDADVIMAVFDSSQPLDADDLNVLTTVQAGRKPLVAVLNKFDLPCKLTEGEIHAALPQAKVAKVSALTGKGVPQLISLLEKLVLRDGLPESGEVMITHARHYSALNSALDSLRHAFKSLESGLSQEFIALDMRGAMDAYGNITGTVSSQEVLDKIFSDFCIGK